MAKPVKTNAMRILETQNAAFETMSYEVDESDLSGVHIAAQLGLDCAKVFKTLVLKGEKRGYIVCCLPVAEELDLKKVAREAEDKRVEMIPMKDLLPVTGYIRGGCSPVGMKKRFPTFIDASALDCDKISVSAGVRGEQVILAPSELIRITGAAVCGLAKTECEDN